MNHVKVLSLPFLLLSLFKLYFDVEKEQNTKVADRLKVFLQGSASRCSLSHLLLLDVILLAVSFTSCLANAGHRGYVVRLVTS